MKSLTTALSFAAMLMTAACANNPNRPTDTGNMALPNRAQGNSTPTTRY